MSKHQTRLCNQTFHDYLKLGIGLQITKDGLKGMVERESCELHHNILQQLPTRKTCSTCLTENVLECPTVDLCKRRRCSFHATTAKKPRACPHNVCGVFRDKIRAAFRYYKPNCTEPSWSNTNAQLWASNPFQLMKCFLPPNRYRDADSVEDLDLDGILSLIINNKRFNDMMTADLSQKDNICAQVKNIGQVYNQSNSLTTSDSQLNAYLDVFLTLLNDQKFLLHDGKAKQSVRSLQQLKEDILQVSSHTVTTILRTAIASTEKDEETKEQEPHELGNEESIHTFKLDVLRGAHDMFSKQSRKFKSSQLYIMTLEQENAVRKAATIKLQESLESENVDSVVEVPFSRALSASTSMDIDITLPIATSSLCESFSFEQLASDLRQDLITFYRERHSSLPLSPLIEKNKAPLLEFYVSPSIKAVGQNWGMFDGKLNPMYYDVNSLADIFTKTTNPCNNRGLAATLDTQKTACKNILLTSPPGTGKTSFVKKIVLTWCQAHKPVENLERYFTKEDIETMRQYDFLFLVILRDAQQECHQDDMIMNLLISQLGQECQYTQEFLQKLLRKETCLVVMDGLDEWKHPKKGTKFCKLGKSDVPHKRAREHCTTLSTTRPWTGSQGRFGHADIDTDKDLEMEGLVAESSKKLIHNVITYLNGKCETGCEKSSTEFHEIISSKRLQKFEANPVILMQLLCLWYEGTDPGESQCQIYSNMLELLFRRAAKDSKVRQYHRRKGKSNMKLPICLALNTYCKENARLLLNLGDLAQATLFPERKGPYLIFDRTVARKHLEESELHKCLAVGILSQSDKQEKITSSEITLTFIHKTFQEFLAALSITSQKGRNGKHNVTNILFEDFTSVKDILQLETILVFLSGLSPKIMSELSEQCRTIVGNDPLTAQYRTNIGTLFLESRVCMNDYCSMMVKCLKESNPNEQEDIEIIHLEDIFVDEQCMDNKHVQSLNSLIQLNANVVKSVSIHVMQTVSDDGVQQIMQQLNMQSISALEKLYIWGKIPRFVLQCLLQKSQHTMKNLELWGMALYEEDISDVSRLMSIECLSFLSITMPHNVFESLLSDLGSRSKLRQINLHDVECIDQPENCRGCVMKLTEKSEPELLLLDKVSLTEIFLNANKLKGCIIEWLPVAGALQSLLGCLENTTMLERFECEFPASQEDTVKLLSTVSKMRHLEYLRLRNVKIDTLNVDIAHLQYLKRVHFCYNSLSSEVLRSVIDQLEMFESQMMVFMDNCNVTPPEKYEELKLRLQTSNRFEILNENNDEQSHLYFKTVPSVNSLKIPQQAGMLSGSRWEQCFCDDAVKTKQIASQLLKEGMLPDQRILDRLCRELGKKDEVISRLCEGICTLIKGKSSKIVQVLPTYSTVSSRESTIIFLVITTEQLTSVVLDEQTYSVNVRQTNKCSSEGRHVMFDESRSKTGLLREQTEALKRCINRHAVSLLKKHKLLSMIAPCPVRSRYYGSENFTIENEPCIVLYVFAKHYIPLDEDPFSKYYDGIPTDVREGYFLPQPAELIPDNVHDTLKIGCQIGSERNRNSYGTLGGFIEHPQYGLCGLTCAHVLLNQSDMEILYRKGTIKWPDLYPTDTVYQPANSSYGVGRVVQAVYKQGMGDQSGMEVAVFQIERRHPITGEFPEHSDTHFNSGRVHGLSRINNYPVLKIGSKTGKTFGDIVLHEPSILVRTTDPEITVGGLPLELNNQLEVKPTDAQACNVQQPNFSNFGDSGSLVLVNDPAGDFTCVGMVEGITSNGTTIVTPITPILEALGVSRLKSFETEMLSNQLRGEIQALEIRVNANINALGDRIMQEIRNART